MSKEISEEIDKLLTKISKLQNKIFVFQTDVLKTSLYYKVKPKIFANFFIKNIEKIFYKKTILFPAFSNDLITKKKFDIKKSSIYTGLIPKLILKKNYYRTFSPLHSFLVKGSNIKEIKKLKQITTWGKGSVYEWLEKKNAVWVALNLEWEKGCAFAHRTEELYKVNFRYFKKYTGALYRMENLKNVSEMKYSNYPTKIIKDYSKSFKRLKKRSNNFLY